MVAQLGASAGSSVLLVSVWPVWLVFPQAQTCERTGEGEGLEVSQSSFVVQPGLAITELVEDFPDDVELIAEANRVAKPVEELVLSGAHLSEKVEEKILLIQFLNSGFLSMTKSWICNVKRLSSRTASATTKTSPVGTTTSLLDATLFVATDQKARDGLKNFSTSNQGTTVNVFLSQTASTLSRGSVEYGKFAYFRMMAWRTMTLLSLMKNLFSTSAQHRGEGTMQTKTSLFLVESDAVWLQNPLQYIFSAAIYSSDVISLNDDALNFYPGLGFPNGGFLLFRPTSGMLDLWGTLASTQRKRLNAAAITTASSTSASVKAAVEAGGNEQIMLTELIKANRAKYKLHLLPESLFVHGKAWYDNEKIPVKDLGVVGRRGKD
eukprot:g20005.t1